MKNTINKIKKVTLATALIATSFTSTGAFAWGPERDTFTMENPASYPIFNSITNNPTIGDERDFVRVGQIDADVTQLGNEVEVVPGKQYLVYIYFHNDASSTYNDSAHNNVGVAVKTTMSSSFENVLTPEKRAEITATITADNSKPGSVWDEAYMTTSSEKILLHYVAGSAKIYNDYKTNGSILPSSLFTEEGTLLGLNELNGVIPGCEQYHGVVSYVLQAEALTGTVDKEVSKDGTNYANSIEALPGDELTFRLTIKNTGNVALTNAVIADAMPSGLELVSGSVQFSANDSGVWESLSDNLIGDGYNFGTIGTGNTIYVTYRAKVSEKVDCNGLNFANTATLTYDSEVATGDKDESSTTINVKKDDCIIPETPKEIVKTGPLEITMAVVVILGIAAGGFYLYRTRRTLKTVEDTVTGSSNNNTSAIAPEAPAAPEAPQAPQAEEASAEPQAPVAPASFSEPATPAAPEAPETPVAPEAPQAPAEPQQEEPNQGN